MDRKKKRLLSPLLERTLDALKGQRSMQTLENYHSSINKVKEFVGDGWEHLTVEDITRGWTDRFTTWLESHHGDKPQTVDFYLRTFRAVYGHALALSSEGTDGKPFSGHHTGGSFPAKRALRKEEVQRLLSPSLRQTLPENQREALDVLLFIFYARGMVFKDVYGLTHRMVTDRHIRYLRSKTGVPIDVEVVPELEEIMKRYHREDSPFVFPFLHEARKGCPRRKGAAGGIRFAANQSYSPYDRAESGTLRTSYNLRAAPHVGNINVGRQPACGTDQPVHGAHLDTYHADLPFPYQ